MQQPHTLTPYGSQCVHTLFVSGDTLTVPIRAASAAAWYDARDYYGVTLAPDVANYLEQCLLRFGFSRKVKQVRILLCCPALAPQQQSAVRSLVERHCAARTAQLGSALTWLFVGAALLALVCALLCAVCITACGIVCVLAAAVLASVLSTFFFCLGKVLSVLRQWLLFTKTKAARIEFKQEPAACEN